MKKVATNLLASATEDIAWPNTTTGSSFSSIIAAPANTTVLVAACCLDGGYQCSGESED